jgi:MT-A70
MAADVARRHPANNSDSTTRARHTEIARRYAWQAQQRRKRRDEKPDPARLLTLIRMRELERLFERRYGRLLPDDDAGRDDLIVAAHHIALLRGDVIKHIVDWARAWAPWMPSAEAERLAERVAAEPRKWTADTLAWRLRLSWAERTDLRITTIGAFDMSKAEREVERKRRRREAERAPRAKRSTERPRGRPKKCVASRDSTIAGHGFSPDADGSAREAPDPGPDVNASTKENLNTSRAASSLLDLVEGQTPLPPSPNSRAAPPPEWRKVTRNGKVRMGCGFWARTMHEPVLLGTVGKPPKFTLPSCFDGIAREHSRKPDEFYRMITERTPDLRRADLFAREKREGWDAWGDEFEKFSSSGADGAPAQLAFSGPLGR